MEEQVEVEVGGEEEQVEEVVGGEEEEHLLPGPL